MANSPNKYVDMRPNSGHLMFHSASIDYASLSIIKMLGPLYYHSTPLMLHHIADDIMASSRDLAPSMKCCLLCQT